VTQRPILCGMATAALAIGCGGEGPKDPYENLSTEWQLVDRAYPYPGMQGGIVCAEYYRLAEHGLIEIDREVYFPDKINRKLDGRIDLDGEARASIRNGGISRVSDCDDARKFMRLKHEYFESLPSMDPPTPDEPPESDGVDPESDRVDKVREGHQYDHFPTVHLRIWNEATITIPNDFARCSGILINQYSIITSAHCFDWGADMYEVSVDYGTAFDNDPANGNWCISNNSPNCFTEPPEDNFFAYTHPDFSGGIDTDDDIAVLIHWTWDPWEVIGDNHGYYMDLTKTAPGEGTSFEVHGYGASSVTGSGQGLGRKGNHTEGVSWTDSEYWLAYATQGYGHPCKGDSGGSAVNWTKLPGTDISMGVFSNYEVSETGDACPRIGNKFRYTKVNPKVGFINTALHDFSAGNCWDYTVTGGQWQAWNCWLPDPGP
jgi:hypothetical protein